MKFAFNSGTYSFCTRNNLTYTDETYTFHGCVKFQIAISIFTPFVFYAIVLSFSSLVLD